VRHSLSRTRARGAFALDPIKMASEFLVNAVGTLAGVCSMASFVPQILKIWRDRDASGVSLRMFGVTVTAFVLWTTFGALQGSWPIIVSNGVCLILAIVIVGLRLRFKDGDSSGQNQT
jgi:MtN3 and saliva related transmembrane protein